MVVARRQNADDSVGFAVHQDCPVYKAWIAAVAPHPERVRQNRLGIVAGLLFVRQKRAALLGTHLEQIKEIRGDAHAPNLFGSRLAGQRVERRLPRGHLGKRAAAFAPIEKFRPRHRQPVGAASRVGFPDEADPFGMWEVQRLQQDGVHHAKNRGARADAQTQRRHREQRHCAILVQHPRREAQVVAEFSEQGSPDAHVSLQ